MKFYISQARTSLLYKILWPYLKKSGVVNEHQFAMAVRTVLNHGEFNLPTHCIVKNIHPASYLLSSFSWADSPQGRGYWSNMYSIAKQCGLEV